MSHREHDSNSANSACETDRAPLPLLELSLESELPPELEPQVLRPAPDPEEWAKLQQEVTAIRLAIETDKSAHRQKDEAFNRLYEELDGYKRNQVFQELKPLYIDLILFFDRMQTAKQQVDPAGAEVLTSLQEELLEILQRRSIELTPCNGDAFDPKFQRAVQTRRVDSPDLDSKVVGVVREGFVCGEYVLRAQEVITGRHR
jgi:molecular chaperone GrpE